MYSAHIDKPDKVFMSIYNYAILGEDCFLTGSN